MLMLLEFGNTNPTPRSWPNSVPSRSASGTGNGGFSTESTLPRRCVASPVDQEIQRGGRGEQGFRQLALVDQLPHGLAQDLRPRKDVPDHNISSVPIPRDIVRGRAFLLAPWFIM
jgi:hypothetical protein